MRAKLRTSPFGPFQSQDFKSSNFHSWNHNRTLQTTSLTFSEYQIKLPKLQPVLVSTEEKHQIWGSLKRKKNHNKVLVKRKNETQWRQKYKYCLVRTFYSIVKKKKVKKMAPQNEHRLNNTEQNPYIHGKQLRCDTYKIFVDFFRIIIQILCKDEGLEQWDFNSLGAFHIK